MKHFQLQLLVLAKAGAALLMASPAFAQIPALNLSGGSGVRSGSVTLALSLTTSGASNPVALQWSFAYSPADIAGLHVTASTALQAAGKSLYCNATSGVYTCIAVGLNANAIPNGELALANITLSSSASSSVSLRVINPLGVSSGGSALPISSGSTTISVAGAASSPTIRVNCGGGAYTDTVGRAWAGDNGFDGGFPYAVSTPIAGTLNPSLYQSLRWQPGNLKYQFAIPNGSYSVTLKFAEVYFSQPGQRRFSVAINGQQVLSDFDIVAAAGGARIAVDRSFTTSANNGAIVIEFLRGSADDPQINAIEIVPVAPVSVPVRVAVAPGAITLQPAQTQQFGATVSGTENAGVTWSLAPSMGTVSAGGLYTAPSVISGDAQVVLTATSLADSSAKASATIGLTPAKTGQSTAIRVNAGGSAYTDSAGQSWAADNGFGGGFPFSVTAPVTGTPNPALYQSLRWQPGNLKYQFAIPNGSYSVILKFAEIYFSRPGQRRFSVAINGQQVLSDFDIVAAAGGPRIAVDRSFTTSVNNGAIVIEFLRGSADDPQINAIEIK